MVLYILYGGVISLTAGMRPSGVTSLHPLPSLSSPAKHCQVHGG